MKILLVGDKEVELAQTAERLFNLGHEIVIATGFDEGFAAFNLVYGLKFVVVSWNLFYEQDGCDLCMKMRRLGRNFSVIYILVSSLGEQHALTKWQDCTKPYDIFLSRVVPQDKMAELIHATVLDLNNGK